MLCDFRGIETRWFPPFNYVGGGVSSDRIVDPTTAGNAFLGSYGVGLLELNALWKAAYCGAISINFALEQIEILELVIGKGEIER